MLKLVGFIIAWCLLAYWLAPLTWSRPPWGTLLFLVIVVVPAIPGLLLVWGACDRSYRP